MLSLDDSIFTSLSLCEWKFDGILHVNKSMTQAFWECLDCGVRWGW
jgi:sucrose-6-phosphate hydrolase SacC (GH32 family)